MLTSATVRNVYLYVNFGDFVDGKANETAPPYIQLLSTTNDTSQADSDFVKARGNTQSWDPSGSSLLARIRAHLPACPPIPLPNRARGLLCFALLCAGRTDGRTSRG